MAVIVSQDHALAADNVLQLNDLAVFHMFVPYVKFDQLRAVFNRVTLHDEQLLRVEDQSLAL